MHETVPEWIAVDDYFVSSLGLEDDALVAARESSVSTTMPRAAVTPSLGALLGLLVRLAGRVASSSSARSPGTRPSGWPAPSGRRARW